MTQPILQNTYRRALQRVARLGIMSLVFVVSLTQAARSSELGSDADLDQCRTVSADPNLYIEWRKKQRDSCSKVLKRSDKIAKDSHYEAYFHRAEANLALDDLQTSASDYTAAIKLKPVAFLYTARAKVLHRMRQYRPALADYEEAFKLDPKTGNGHTNYLRGTLYADIGDLDAALNDFNIAVSVRPTLQEVYIARGALMRRKGDLDRAIANYAEAIKLLPNDFTAYYNRGNAFDAKGDYDSALQDFTEAIRLNPNHSFSRLNRGIIYRDSGQLENALTDFNEAARIEPNEPRNYYNRAMVFLEANQFQKVIDDMSISIKLDSEYPDANRIRGYASMALQRFPNAKADLDRAITLNGQDAYAYLFRGQLSLLHRNYDAMRVDLDRAAALAPSDPGIAEARKAALDSAAASASRK